MVGNLETYKLIAVVKTKTTLQLTKSLDYHLNNMLVVCTDCAFSLADKELVRVYWEAIHSTKFGDDSVPKEPTPLLTIEAYTAVSHLVDLIINKTTNADLLFNSLERLCKIYSDNND